MMNLFCLASVTSLYTRCDLELDLVSKLFDRPLKMSQVLLNYLYCEKVIINIVSSRTEKSIC